MPADTAQEFDVSRFFVPLLERIDEEGYYLFGNEKKQAFEILSESGDKAAQISIPPSFTSLKDQEKLKEFLSRSPHHLDCIFLVFIQAGDAVLGVLSNEEMLEEKLIRKYMVRKKQGKSQLTHLNQKGKSKAGSRIRLKQSERFFEDINAVLQAWSMDYKADKILYTCPPNLMPWWFQSAQSPPFSKTDDRLQKANWYTGKPSKKALFAAIKEVYKARFIIFEPQLKSLLQEFV